MMTARPFHCALALVSTVLLTSPARAASPTTPDTIPATCGSRSAFDTELGARLGPDAPIADVRVSIEPRAAGFHLRLALGAEHRELEDPSCTELFRAAIVIAVSLLLERRPSTTPLPAPAYVSSPPPLPPPRPSFGVAFGTGLAAGTLPEPVLALELEGKALWRHAGVGVNLRYLLPAERRDETEQGVELTAWGAGVLALFRPSQAWEARVGFAGQRLSGRGVGVDRGYSDAVWAAGPTLGLAWTPLRRGRFRAGLGAEGQLNLVRGRFEILNHSGQLTGETEVIYRVPALAADAFVRLGLVW
jgi:hypothetical protein